jgi:hypothetical protein
MHTMIFSVITEKFLNVALENHLLPDAGAKSFSPVNQTLIPDTKPQISPLLFNPSL